MDLFHPSIHPSIHPSLPLWELFFIVLELCYVFVHTDLKETYILSC